MAQADPPPREPPPNSENALQSLLHRILRRSNGAVDPSLPSGQIHDGAHAHREEEEEEEEKHEEQVEVDHRPSNGHRPAWPVVPGLPRAQTFKRQLSEVRNRLEPHQPTLAERRAVSVDRRANSSTNDTQSQSQSQSHGNPRASAPEFLDPSSYGSNATYPRNGNDDPEETAPHAWSPTDFGGPRQTYEHLPHTPYEASNYDTRSLTTSQYDDEIHRELERTWILNLSMHFRDRSKREKFFVTYRHPDGVWRRVTVSLDYRDAPLGSLEQELLKMDYQKEKSATIYEAIRHSLKEIVFYDTVTNLKLQTTDGRLHVHVVEDVNETIDFPSVKTIRHVRCAHIKEKDIDFLCHMSGFVYKVRVNGETLIKKEIPGPDMIEEFLYEVNALNRLRYSNNVIRFYGVVVDDGDERVKGLLISYADKGALIDVIQDAREEDLPLPWAVRSRWARQIVHGLSEIHEAGFVQGDFTVSNIVIDEDDNAKIIDINRRGCPIGWEPPEATPLIESNQRISMYIGVKSDLFQLGMVLWALAMRHEEPESLSRPLALPSDLPIPSWYRRIVDICLSEDPRRRLQAIELLTLFPEDVGDAEDGYPLHQIPSVSVDSSSAREGFADEFPDGRPRIKTVEPRKDWSYVDFGNTYVAASGMSDGPYYYPISRGRSLPSPVLQGLSGPSQYREEVGMGSWSYSNNRLGRAASTISDISPDEEPAERRSITPKTSRDSLAAAAATQDVVDDPTVTMPTMDPVLEEPAQVHDEATPQTEIKVPLDEDPTHGSDSPESASVTPQEERAEEIAVIPEQTTKTSQQETKTVAAEDLGITAPENRPEHVSEDALIQNEPAPQPPASEQLPVDEQPQASEQPLANEEPLATRQPQAHEQPLVNEQPPTSEPPPTAATDAGELTTAAEASVNQNSTVSEEVATAELHPTEIIPAESPRPKLPSELSGIGSAYDLTGPERRLSLDDDFDVHATANVNVRQRAEV